MRREERRYVRPSSLKGVSRLESSRIEAQESFVGDGESNTSETGTGLMQEVLNLERERIARYCDPGPRHDIKFEH